MSREPIFAGKFYPSERKVLERDIRGCLCECESKFDAKGIIVPHAGYPFSGSAAGKVYSSILPKKNLILLGPNHTGLGADIALSDESWRSPFGVVAQNDKVIKTILSSGVIERDDLAHKNEHSLEVQLPFIQYLFQAPRVVPISVKTIHPDQLDQISDIIVEAIGVEASDTLIVSSTDMTHYESRKSAKEKDFKAIEKIEQIDAEGLCRVISEHNISMCGYLPTALMLACVKKLGAGKAELLEYTDSGYVTADTEQVVSYAGMVLY